ncbi:MAG TPA: M28 family peptidase [Candidatus Deferrimicrobium sp.]|nr:M28 family peptidase [Candidatus Deferrimicrobium sp.]
MELDYENAYRITERLSFPRLIGSEGEKKAIETVSEEFQKAGFSGITHQDFETSFFNWFIARFIFLPLGLILITAAYLLIISPIVSIILSILMLLVGMYATRFSSSGDKPIGKKYPTENLFVKLPAPSNKIDILFMAHWDSKSQTFSTLTRIILFVIAIFGALVLAVLIFIGGIISLTGTLNLQFYWGVLISSIVIAVIANLNIFNKTGNESPGSLDNAASVGVMLELARYFKANPPKNINLTFISTGSEELNLGGANAFIKKHKHLDPSRTYFINFDGIGGKGIIRLITSYGFPKKSSSDKLNALFMEVAKDNNIICKSIWLPVGAWSDYMPVIQAGFEACWLASQGSMLNVHLASDNMDTISKEGLKNVLILNIGVIKKLDSEFS